MKYYIKNAVLPFVYLFFMAITAFGILTIADNLLWLKYILLTLNLGLYLFIVCAYGYKMGQDAMKTRNANDLERKQIVLTGELRPLKLDEEYKPFKGAVIGLTACAPLIIALLLHTVLGLCGVGNGAGIAACIIYLCFFAFFRANTAGVAQATFGTYYISLVAIPFIVAAMGVFYYLGAKKIERQYQRIRENQRRIYGEDK